jgi:hypothetical protein
MGMSKANSIDVTYVKTVFPPARFISLFGLPPVPFPATPARLLTEALHPL